MTESAKKLTKRVLRDIYDTLDIHITAQNLNIDAKEAQALLRSLADAPKSKTQRKATPSKPKSGESLVVYVDGGSRGNPGPAGAGAIIKDGAGNPVKSLHRYLGVATNNVAEYEALILALTEARELTSRIEVFADSELVVKQIKGIYRVKNPALKELFGRAKKLIASFDSFKITHIRRELNSEADHLANKAMDSR